MSPCAPESPREALPELGEDEGDEDGLDEGEDGVVEVVHSMRLELDVK